MKKCAILLSGYFRLYNHLFKNFQQHLLYPLEDRGYEIHIFFSTWNKLNTNDCASFKFKADGQPTYGNFDLNDILNKYKPKKYLVSDFEEHKQEFNILNYDKTLDLTTLHPNIHENGILFNLTQYYHRFQANKLKQEYERENNFKYDAVIMMRPDIFFLKPFDITKIDLNKLNIRTFYNDAFHICNNDMNDKICNLYSNIQNIVDKYGRNKFEWFETYCPEHFLEYYLLDIGITKEQRVELGEDLFYYFPRNFFAENCYEIYKKTNQLQNFQYVVNYFGLK